MLWTNKQTDTDHSTHADQHSRCG